MKVAVLQPSYIPWRGYFHQIHKADIFVFYDDVQYDKHGWRNRNRIKTPNGARWLTIPVHSRGNIAEQIAIRDIEICWTKPWNVSHWDSIRQSYKRAPYFRKYAELIESFYKDHPEKLADYTIRVTEILARELGTDHTEFVRSSDVAVAGSKTDRLLGILKQLGASEYITGPAARDYLDEARLEREGIRVEYMEYDYPEYAQLHSSYDPRVSILDLLLTKGPSAASYIWSTGQVGNQ